MKIHYSLLNSRKQEIRNRKQQQKRFWKATLWVVFATTSCPLLSTFYFAFSCWNFHTSMAAAMKYLPMSLWETGQFHAVFISAEEFRLFWKKTKLWVGAVWPSRRNLEKTNSYRRALLRSREYRVNSSLINSSIWKATAIKRPLTFNFHLEIFLFCPQKSV